MTRSIPIGYALANLPRYTSYPTAPHFTRLDAAEYRDWLGDIGGDTALSLYLHVPFCKTLCWYCGCHTAITRNDDRIARYAAALRLEAQRLAEVLDGAGQVTAIHLGGGTPTALGAAALAELLGTLRVAYRLAPGAEVAVECDPRTLDAPTVAALAGAGVTRVSLGVQDIDAGVQRRIGRPQPLSVVTEAIGALRAAGIDAINCDLMYGLPGQTVAHVVASAAAVAALGAARVAVFGYAHVPWMKSHQNAIREDQLPGALERVAQAEAAEATLVAAGYVAIGLDHFARPADSMAIAAASGRLRRNFQGYTTDDAPALLGLGASAIGSLPAGYVQNEPDERRYVAAVEAGELPVRRGRAVSEEDRLRRACIERVMCDFALDLRALPGALVTDTWPALERLAADGIIDLAPGALRVTAAGRRQVRHVAAAFDAYLSRGAARHSRAV